jgi:hypothetical protein
LCHYVSGEWEVVKAWETAKPVTSVVGLCTLNQVDP